MMPVAPPTDQLDLPVDSTSVFDAAALYARAGFAPVPVYGVNASRCDCGRSDCSAAGKHPVGGNWQKRARADVDIARELFQGHTGNIGIVVGAAHVVVDIDYYHGGREGLETLPSMPPTLTSRSGSGQGEHRIFALAPGQDAEEITNRKVAEGVDIKTRTGQIVVAPSLHRSGNRYQWIDLTPPAPLPSELYERIRKRRVVAIQSARPASSDSTLLRRAQAYVARLPAAVSGQDGHRSCFAAARACWGWIEKGLPEPDGWTLFLSYNQRCDPPWSERELSHKWKEARQADRIPVIEDRAPAPPPFATLPEPELDWRARLIYQPSKSGPDKPAKHHENAVVVLRYCPAWKGRLHLDEHAQRVMVTAPPWHESDAPAPQSTEPREWTDADSARLSSWIRRDVFGLDLTVADCDRAVAIAAEANPRHPFREYLDGLTWDNTPRLAEWLHLCLGAPQSDYAASVGRWWLIAACARTYQPGCKVDNVLILEGAQGLRKSSALRLLASPRFFSDTPIDLHSKDAYLALQGRVIVELGELESLRKVDADRAKVFFSSPVDQFRPPYGKRTISVPRGCVFAGSVNHSVYLTDTTGNRRYWPVLCGQIDLELLAQARDQLWAEAAWRFKAGEPWWPATADEVALCAGEQVQRVEADAWSDMISQWARDRDEVAVLEVWEGCFRADASKLTRREEIRIARALQADGFARRQKRIGGGRVWVYVR